tara:strand:+ start:522 stop:962 length:441 start_codon:yes stop_codon:yes gene_type:complete
MTSLNDFKNMYWSIIEKKKILENNLLLKENIITRLQNIIKDLNKENDKLKNDLIKKNNNDNTDITYVLELQKKIDIYEKNILYGTIKTVTNKGFGYITSDDYGDIYFHISDFCKDTLDHRFVNMNVKFNLIITSKGYRGINVNLKF